ncbi:MAG: M20/M25/M40 family metallo-hydrolase [Nitrososphaerota archaeon]|nr:M20/M25/M40 family metallo-hydrolase [Nitrososphaerota archaeon]
MEFSMNVINAYSPSNDEGSVAGLIRDELTLRGFRPKIDAAGNVVCEHGAGSMSLLLCGHMDTVPGRLPVKNENGELYGRGACDAKGPLLSLLFAFEDLVTSNLQGRVVFAAVTGEELTSAGLAELIKNQMRSDYAIFGEPGGVSKITVGYRGHLTIRLEVNTPEVHASAPKLTTNAAELLFEIYNSIKLGLDAVKSESTDRISASLTQISGGSAHNVIPGNVSASIDVRVPVKFLNEHAMAKIREVIASHQKSNPEAKIVLELKDTTDPYQVRLDSPLVRALTRSILKTGKKPSFVTKSGTGDMNTYASEYSIDAVTYGPGDAKLSHTSDEHVSFKEILECSAVVASAATELVTMTSKKMSV